MDILQRTTQLLQPFMGEDRRGTFLTLAFHQQYRDLYDAIPQNGPPAAFTVRCVSSLLDHGCVGSRHALSVLLDEVLRAAGESHHEEIRSLIDELDLKCAVALASARPSPEAVPVRPPIETTQPGLVMFKDHCVVAPSWLAEASNRGNNPPPIEWHPKIRRALDLVAANGRNIDKNVDRFLRENTGDASQEITSQKVSFFNDQATLDEVLRKTERAYTDLFNILRQVPPDLRARSLHTYAASGALYLIKTLQRFEGMLLTDAGRLILRLFPDLPNLRHMKDPLVGLPFTHPVNVLAYGNDARSGFLFCRISCGSESDYKYLHLPRFDAEAFQDECPGPIHLYYGWVVPQWLIFFDDPPPGADVWWIPVLKDDHNVERFKKSLESPWSSPRFKYLDLPSTYRWSTDSYECAEIGPGMSCWLMRQASDTVLSNSAPPTTDPGVS